MNSKLVSPAFGTQETVVSCCLFGLCFCHRILFLKNAFTSFAVNSIFAKALVNLNIASETLSVTN